MKAFLIIQMASCCLALVSCSRTVDYATETERMLDELDHTLEKKAAYEEAGKLGLRIVSKGIEALPCWKNGIRFFIFEGPNGERLEIDQKL